MVLLQRSLWIEPTWSSMKHQFQSLFDKTMWSYFSQFWNFRVCDFLTSPSKSLNSSSSETWTSYEMKRLSHPLPWKYHVSQFRESQKWNPKFLSFEMPKCWVSTCFTNSWPHIKIFSPLGHRTSRFRESHYKTFGSPSHDTLKWSTKVLPLCRKVHYLSTLHCLKYLTQILLPLQLSNYKMRIHERSNDPISPEIYTLENTRPNSPCSSTRSDGSWDFANSPWRISTIHFLLDNSHKLNKLLLRWNLSACKVTLQCLSLNASRY